MKTQIRQQNGVSILEPSGRLVGHSVSELRKVILPEIEASDTPRILIDFKNVNKVDSSGLGTLMEARVAITQKKGRIGAIHVGRNIKSLVVQSRMVQLFEHFDDEAAAVSALSA